MVGSKLGWIISAGSDGIIMNKIESTCNGYVAGIGWTVCLYQTYMVVSEKFMGMVDYLKDHCCSVRCTTWVWWG